MPYKYIVTSPNRVFDKKLAKSAKALLRFRNQAIKLNLAK